MDRAEVRRVMSGAPRRQREGGDMVVVSPRGTGGDGGLMEWIVDGRWRISGGNGMGCRWSTLRDLGFWGSCALAGMFPALFQVFNVFRADGTKTGERGRGRGLRRR